MLLMLFFRLGVNEDVVDENNNELIKVPYDTEPLKIRTLPKDVSLTEARKPWHREKSRLANVSNDHSPSIAVMLIARCRANHIHAKNHISRASWLEVKICRRLRSSKRRGQLTYSWSISIWFFIGVEMITRSINGVGETISKRKQDRLRKRVTQKEPNVYPILTGHSLSSKVIRTSS
ncbi:hypothetical protein Tco_0868851 [Tanacetum coccineum]